MATSSITANFLINDPKEAKRFVSRLLSRQEPKSFQKPDFKFISDVDTLRNQIAKSH